MQMCGGAFVALVLTLILLLIYFALKRERSHRTRREVEANRSREIDRFSTMSDLEFLKSFGAVSQRGESARAIASHPQLMDAQAVYSRGGFIYVVPARIPIVADDSELDHRFVTRIQRIFESFSHNWKHSARPAVYKIGYTEAVPEDHIAQLNAYARSLHSDSWELGRNWVASYWVGRSLERKAVHVHAALRPYELFEEVFYTSFDQIDRVVTSIAATEVQVTMTGTDLATGLDAAHTEILQELRRVSMRPGVSTCRMCHGDGGAGGRCPACGGNGLA